MGYETTVFIVDCYKPPEFTEREGVVGKKACYMGSFVAKVELCKIGTGHPLDDLFSAGRKQNKEDGHYPFVEWQRYTNSEGEEDEKPLILDCYDDHLSHHKGVDVLQALERTMAANLLNEEYVYRRFAVLRDTLKSVLATFPPDNIWVLTYGH